MMGLFLTLLLFSPAFMTSPSGKDGSGRSPTVAHVSPRVGGHAIHKPNIEIQRLGADEITRYQEAQRRRRLEQEQREAEEDEDDVDDEEEQNEKQRPATAARAFKFMCPNCDRLFPTRESKLRHVRLNACEEKLHCGYCFLVVYTRHALIKHENNHVKRGFSTDGFVPCAKCSRGFARDNWKEEHEATCKGISQQDLEAEGDKEERIIAQLKEAAAAEAEDSNASWPCLACDQVSQPT